MKPLSSKGPLLENELVGNLLKGISPDVQDHGKIFWWTLPEKAGL
jgi:hypothetical protein